MCDVKGCNVTGECAPQLVFRMIDRVTRQHWDIPVIVGLRFCGRCRATVTEPKEVLGDGGAQIVDTLLRMRSTARHKRTRLGWVSVNSVEFKRFLERPS